METAVNTTIDGRLDDLEAFESSVGTQYALPSQTGVMSLQLGGIDGGDVYVTGYFVLHSPYAISGSPAKVTILLDGLDDTAGSYVKLETPFSASSDYKIPSAIRPSADKVIPVTVINNSLKMPGLMIIEPDGDVRFHVLDSGAFSTDFLATGNKGFTQLMVEYLLD